MRMFKPLFLALSIAIVIPTQSTAVEIPATFQVQGAGYGHGVGMSQIGARAKALAGETATAILSYYYKDVVLVEQAYVKNPDQTIAVVVFNQTQEAKSIHLVLNDKSVDISISPQAIQTITIPSIQ